MFLKFYCVYFNLFPVFYHINYCHSGEASSILLISIQEQKNAFDIQFLPAARRGFRVLGIYTTVT